MSFNPPVRDFDDWVELLQRTLQNNNWHDLHEGFQCNFYFRRLKDTLDYFEENQFNIPPEHWDWKNIKDSIERNRNLWSAFCQSFSLKACMLGSATKQDINTVMNMYIRAEQFSMFKDRPDDLDTDWRLLTFVSEAFKKYKHDENVNTLDQAFGLVGTQGKRQTNPYYVPDWVFRVVADIIDNDISANEAFKNEDQKTSYNDFDTMKTYFQKKKHEDKNYKWIGLNSYLHDRIIQKRGDLTDKEIKRVESIWHITLPSKLEVYWTNATFAFAKIKSVKAQVIKGKSSKTKH